MHVNFSSLSIESLQELIAAAQTELDSRAPKKEFTIQIETASYNERRYGKPWIAKVAKWEIGGQPQLEFGAFVGEHGYAGAVEIKAKAGDIIRHGQKDNRGNNTTAYWGVIETDGLVRNINATEARKLYGEK